MNIHEFYKGKAIGFVIVLVVVLAGYFLIHSPTNMVEENPDDKVTGEETPIKITEVDIKEANFTGKKPVVEGSARIAVEARKYIDDQVKMFKADADIEVPDMRDKFGEDHPTANYTFEMEAKYVPGTKTDSIVLSSYLYTGGANGNSLYTVFTENNATGELYPLSKLVKADKQEAFTDLVKKSLISWRPEGSEGLVVFEEVIQEDLTFEMLKDYTLDEKNLTLYFDKYEIGPGALGAVPFAIPLSRMEGMLTL